jgi:hypothetical protein
VSSIAKLAEAVSAAKNRWRMALIPNSSTEVNPIASLCNAANNVLFDYLSGAADQRGWESDSKRPGGLKIDDEFDLYGRSVGLAPLRIRPA